MPKSPQKKPHQTQQSNPPPVKGTENVVEVETVTADQTEAEETEATVGEAVIAVIEIVIEIETAVIETITETIGIVTDITDDNAAGHAIENSKNQHAGQEVVTEPAARKLGSI